MDIGGTYKRTRIIIAGGGTGGHIFPALSIAGKMREVHPKTEIKFVGALGRMEMEKVPAFGYPIVGLPVSGFDRENPFRNIKVLFNLFQSLWMARKILREFRPQVAIGVGGYASAPIVWMAALMGIPTLIQEQNSYAGVANRLLSRSTDTICVAYPEMQQYFPINKIVYTGNPIRMDFEKTLPKREEACTFFGLDPSRKIVLSLGGSLGALTINESISQGLVSLPNNIQLIWQTGKSYYPKALKAASGNVAVKVFEFIQQMDMAFSAADLVISRAGAGTISELSVLEKPCILVPSPNVAEDHQTRNAEALVKNKAALMIADNKAREQLLVRAQHLLSDRDLLTQLSQNIGQFAKPNASRDIVKEVWKLAQNRKDD